MGTEENKAVVRRFGDALTTGRITDHDLLDELLAPNYVNLAMGDADLATFKAMSPAMGSVMKAGRCKMTLPVQGSTTWMWPATTI
jgi:hypothetical protein